MSVAAALGLLAALSAEPSVPPIAIHSPMGTMAGDSTPVFFAEARRLARAGRHAEAMASYYLGAAAARTPKDWELYRHDIAWIATPSELREWDGAGGEARPAFLRRFWGDRDQREGLASGDRLAEHVRRLDVALRDYAIHPKRGRTPIMRVGYESAHEGGGSASQLLDFAPTQGQLDDRGVVFVRQGAPSRRLLTVRPSLETWVYERDGGTMTVNFAQNFFQGQSGNGVLVAQPPAAALPALCEVDALACRIAARPSAPPEMWEQLRQRGLAVIRTLTTTDTGPVLEHT